MLEAYARDLPRDLVSQRHVMGILSELIWAAQCSRSGSRSDRGAVDRCDDGDDALAVIALFEMLTGQIFLVTLVAGLVSLWRPWARAAEEAGGGDEQRA
jgi:hypothetical protein